jgi:hypothetical protein
MACSGENLVELESKPRNIVSPSEHLLHPAVERPINSYNEK